MAGTDMATQAENQAELERMVANFASVLTDERARATDVCDELGKQLVAEIQRLISIVGPPPSAPGEPPRIESGELHDSYDYQVTEEGVNVGVTVGSDKDYSVFLEFGTVNMEPRPHVRPAVETITRVIPQIVVDTMGEGGSSGISGTPGFGGISIGVSQPQG